MAHQLLDQLDLPSLQLLSAFLAMEPPDCLINLARKCGGGSVTEGVQKFIWEHCISKADEKCHAPYLRNFLKKVIQVIESTGGEVLDEFYERYAYYMASLKDDTTVKGNSWIVKYISFLFHDGATRLVVPLHCSLNMLGGDTGCALWPSSLFLSEFILSFPGIFTNKTCFEVGAGVGLVGICLERVKASQVILSDGDLSTLANLKLNLEMNQLCEGDVVKCIHLPWESAKENELREFKPDIVLGADVIYDPSCLPHLVRLLSIILNQGKAGDDCEVNSFEHESGSSVRNQTHKPDSQSCNPDIELVSMEWLTRVVESGKVAFIASVIRNVDTFNYFVCLARHANLTVRDLSATARPVNLLSYMQSYSRSDVRLLMLSRMTHWS